MNALDSSKIKTFLMAKNDREKDIVDPDVNDEDRKLHRMNFKNLGKKLNSARLSNILKALIALILWCYIIQTQQEGELEKTVDPNPNKISINDKIKRRWQTIKHSQTTGGKKDFDEMVKEASDAHRDLTQRGLLYEGDNSRNSESARGFSTNFVRLFIRYVQRTFSELDNYVKIYYYQSTCFYYGGEESERKDKEYWGEIKSLVTSSKEDGMIYFVVNQYVSNERTNVNDGGGHGNLTIVCGGNYKVFETVRGCEYMVMDHKDYDKKNMNITSGTIQADAQNCLTIALGYMESLMKQIYGWSKEQQWSSQKKEFSEYVWNKINRYSTVNLPDDIQGVDTEPLKVLLPAKYIKYIQTSAGRDKLIELAKSKTLREEDRDAIEEVAEELIKVRDRYNLSEKPLEPFLRDVAENDRIVKKWLKLRLNKIAKAAGMKLSEMKWKDVKEFMGKKRIKATFDKDSKSKYQIIWKKSSGERVKLSLTAGPEGNISEPIVKIFSEQMPEERNDVERELINSPIYKVVSDNPEKISWSKLEDDEKIYGEYP